MNKKLIIKVELLVVLLPLVACKTQTGDHASTVGKTTAVQKTQKEIWADHNTAQQTAMQHDKVYSTCDALIIDLVKSSNASAVKKFRELKVRVVELSAEKISIELYVSSDISENPSVKKITENSVGWLEFFPLQKKLQDITNDPEMPEILKYDATILSKIDLNKLCTNAKSSGIEKENTENDVICYRKDGNDYSFKYICEYRKIND